MYLHRKEKKIRSPEQIGGMGIIEEGRGEGEERKGVEKMYRSTKTIKMYQSKIAVVSIFCFFFIGLIELYLFPLLTFWPLHLPSALSVVPMLPIYSDDLVFCYFPCRLNTCVSLLGPSLLSRFSGM